MPKITKIGDSLGVVLPPEALEALGLVQGDEVTIQRRGSVLEIVPVFVRPKLRPAVQRALDETIAQFGPALEELAE